jgi:hypothetical protein
VPTLDSLALNNRVVTLSFWARAGNDFSGTLTAQIYFGQGTDEDLLAGFSGATSVSGSIGITPTWQKFTLTTFAGGFTQIGAYFAHQPAGTASTNDFFEIALVQLAPSLPGEPFLHRSVAEELALCLRFYNVVTGTATMAGLTGSPNGYYGYHAFPVPMRASPTLTLGSAVNMIAGGLITLASVGKDYKSFYSAAESGNNTTSLITFSWSASAEL